jgi:hypothetical protein
MESLVPCSSFPFPPITPEKGTSFSQSASSRTAASAAKGCAPIKLNAATKE